MDELARLRLSLNYRRVMYLEKKMGLSVIKQFTGEAVVSQPGIRLGLFTVGDTDNNYVDHNQSSTTSAESFPWHCYSVVSRTFYHERWAEKRHIFVVIYF